MNPIWQRLQAMLFPQAQKLISPLPQNTSPGGFNDPTQVGLNAYYQREGQANQITPQQAMQSTNSFQPQTIQYPSWIAQTPSQSNNQAIGQALKTLAPGGAQKTAASENQAGEFLDQVDKIFTGMGLPKGLGPGTWAMEGRGKTINPNNQWNIGAYDTNPNNASAYDFKDPLEGAKEAAKFFAGDSDYQTPQVQAIFKGALKQFKKDHDAQAYLQKVTPTYSSNPQYAAIVQQTPEFQQYNQ